MVTRDFVLSARRHLLVCKVLLNHYSANGTSADAKHNIADEICYLSGYVIETMLSYVLCNKMGVTGEVLDSEHFQTRAFKTHDLNAKVLYLRKYNCNINGVIFISRKASKNIQHLYNNWSVSFRYEKCSSLRQTADLNQYVSNLSQFIEEILSKYPLI